MIDVQQQFHFLLALLHTYQRQGMHVGAFWRSLKTKHHPTPLIISPTLLKLKIVKMHAFIDTLYLVLF